RVFSFGFAYGVGEHSERRWGDRYGEGTLAGRRAMVVVTIGGWREHYGARGINGPIDDLLFPHPARDPLLPRLRCPAPFRGLSHGPAGPGWVRAGSRSPARAHAHPGHHAAHPLPEAKPWRLSDPNHAIAPGP